MKETDIVTMTVAEYEAMKKAADEAKAPIEWVNIGSSSSRIYVYKSKCGNYLLVGDFGYAVESKYSETIKWHLHDVRKGTKTPYNK